MPQRPPARDQRLGILAANEFKEMEAWLAEVEAGMRDRLRADSVEAALTYTDQYKKTSFTAMSDTYVFTDDKSFPSNGTTYYTCSDSRDVG